MSYRQQHSFDKRYHDARNQIARYPNSIPVVIERAHNSTSVAELPRQRFSVNRTRTFSALSSVIRQKLKLSPDEALYYMCGNTLLGGADLMDTIYKEHADADGYLYITYMAESTFG